ASPTQQRSTSSRSQRRRTMVKRLIVSARILPDGPTVKAVGRDGWALLSLIGAGASGCTPIEHVGPRWSHYVWKLKRLGLSIETITESHSGLFPGHHARYVLRTPVEILERS